MPVQPNYTPVPEYIPLPPRFADRFRWGPIVVGVVLIVGTVLFFGISAFFSKIFHDRAFPGTVTGLVAIAAPPLFVLATAVTVLTARRCLQGDYLVVSKARETYKALILCLAGSGLATLFAVLLPFVADLWADGNHPKPSDLFTPFLYLIFSALGFLVGHFYVRPSTGTLRKFSDHPIW
ncbi:hypothetical protein [Amycolatopsis sp. H20-H5]|uniref:hypothetical protein n=1 Tax=Amycolatopsis sp. H20-H5 TaxID=3046309 RepID=UPI002DB998D9|nr:hypothetical protein [Amycolatopsis sp. H20-H5]MEC3981780.1 hypothetical protein [Amycolatopsis sp. H20-H5]